MDDDEVVKEIDVFLTKELQNKLWLMQYPVRPVECSYEDEQFLSTKIKPIQKKVNIELSIDTTSDSYLKSKGEHLAMSVDGPIPKGPPTYASGKLDRIDLMSAQGTPKCDRYAVAAVTKGQVHLTPLSAIIQMRPDLGFLDQAEAASKARAQLLDLDGDSSQDEEEEVKAVTVKFARQETAEQKSRRMKSYDYQKRKQSEETWIQCQYSKSNEGLSGAIRHRLLASNQEVSDVYCSPSEYLSELIPKSKSDTVDNPDMPSNVLSMSQLRSMPLNERVRAIVTNAKVIKWSQLLSLLDNPSDQSSVLLALQQAAVLVQGCWVVKSEILHPKDSFSAHSSSPAEIISRARDFVLWKFTQSRSLIRRDVSNIVKIPSEEMKEMLEQIAKPKAKQGWLFNFEFDQEFVNKYKDVAERQQLLWNAKYQQLMKHFPLLKDLKPGEVQKGRRRRHSSRSKSRSDVSDTEGEKSPSVVTLKKEFNFGTGQSTNHSLDTGTGQNGAETDEGHLVRELSALLRDKLLVNFVFNMGDMRRIYQTKLAQCPPGHVLATGVSDSLLEKTVLTSGATKINSMSPPGSVNTFYLLTDAGDTLDPVRKCLADSLQKDNKVKSVTLRQELEQRNIAVSETGVKQMLKDYCVFRAGYWFLKGSIIADS